MNHNHFSNLSFPCPKEAPNEIWVTLAHSEASEEKSFEILNIFPKQMYGIQTNA